MMILMNMQMPFSFSCYAGQNYGICKNIKLSDIPEMLFFVKILSEFLSHQLDYFYFVKADGRPYGEKEYPSLQQQSPCQVHVKI